jgi:glycerol uptake facilitator-like aquaporin
MFFLKTLMEPLGADIGTIVTNGLFTDSHPFLIMVLEAVLTFFLVNTILHTMIENKGGGSASWAIGATLAFTTLVGFLFTGDAMNPARTLAAGIFAAPSLTSIYTYVVFLFGPLIGSTLAVVVFNILNSTPKKLRKQKKLEKKPSLIKHRLLQKN